MTMGKGLNRLLSGAFMFSATLIAQQSNAPASLAQSEVESMVQQLEAEYVAAYNHRDASAVAALYTDGATVLGESGAVMAGRAQIQRALTAAFAQSTGAKIEDTPKHSAAVSRDVIITQGTSRVTAADTSQPPQTVLYTKVLMREGEKWRIAAAQYARPNPWILTFPPTAVGQTSSVQPITLTNIGTSGLSINRISLTGKAASDFRETDTCKGSIPASGSCILSFVFHPTGRGHRTAEFSFWDNGATGRHAVKLTGSGQ